MSIPTSIVLFVTVTVLSANITAFPITIPTNNPSSSSSSSSTHHTIARQPSKTLITKTTTTTSTTTTARFLFARKSSRRGQKSKPPKQQDQSSNGEVMDDDGVDQQQKELEEFAPPELLAEDGSEQEQEVLHQEIVRRSAYLDGLGRRSTDEEKDDEGTEVDLETSPPPPTSRRSSFSVTRLLSSLSRSFTGSYLSTRQEVLRNDDDFQTPVSDSSGDHGLGIGTDNYVDRPDGSDTNIIDKKDDYTENDSTVEWDVYIDQSRSSKKKGAAATLDSFLSLSPPNLVKIHPAILSKTKGKGPTVRCIQRTPTTPHAFEVNNVNDVDKVYLILTRHMKIPSVPTTALSCLKHTHRGNAHLQQNNLSAAIREYDKALSPSKLHPPDEGSLLLLRANVYLQRATEHRAELRTVVEELRRAVPRHPDVYRDLLSLARDHPTLATGVLRRYREETVVMRASFRRTKYRHGLYEYSLLNAARDSLRASRVMPGSAEACRMVGDSLAELRKLEESVGYYERAMELDPGLEEAVRPVVGRLMKSWEFLERAKAMGWSEDTLTLALDVTG